MLSDRVAAAYFSLKNWYPTSRTNRVNIPTALRACTSRYNDGRRLRVAAKKQYFSHRRKQLLDTTRRNYISRTHRQAYFSPTGGLLLDTKRAEYIPIHRNDASISRIGNLLRDTTAAAQLLDRKTQAFPSRIAAAYFSIKSGRLLRERKE